MNSRFKAVAQLMRSARTEEKLSQKAVAVRLGYSSSQFVSNWERGLAAPPVAILRKLASIYKLDPEKLFRTILKDTEQQMRREFKASS